MARELGDVLHYFIPESEAALPAPARVAARLPGVVVPIGEGDVLRAAFVWNLAVEATRAGRPTTVIAAQGGSAATLWPAPGPGPMGAELVLCDAEDPEVFEGTWRQIAADRARESSGPGLVIACVPGAWLEEPRGAKDLLDWVLLFVTPEPRDLEQAYARAEHLLRRAPDAKIGVTLHGVRSVADARRAFLGLASSVERQLGRPLLSYGLLLDDLHVYRAIVDLRPIGLIQPQSRAARALRDVARLIVADAGSAEGD